MKRTGIICEYNPFTNGRSLHLNRAKELVDSNFKYEKTSKIFEDYVKEIANFKPDSAYRWGNSINYKDIPKEKLEEQKKME